MSNRGFILGIVSVFIAICFLALIIIGQGNYGNTLRNIVDKGTIIEGELIEFKPYTRTYEYDGKTRTTDGFEVAIRYKDDTGNLSTLEEDWTNHVYYDQMPRNLQLEYSVGDIVPLIYSKRKNGGVEVYSLNHQHLIDAARDEFGRILLENGVSQESVKTFTSLKRRFLTKDEKAIIVNAIKRRTI